MNAQIVIIFAISICAALAAPTERPDANYDPSLDGDYNYEGYQYDLTADQYACMNAPELTLGIDALCNGRADCPERDDELPEICELYGREAPSSSQAVTSTPTPETPAASLAPLAASSTESDYPEYEDTCMSDEFMCPSDYICIPKIALCDGESDCSGSEDEQNCGSGRHRQKPPTSSMSTVENVATTSRAVTRQQRTTAATTAGTTWQSTRENASTHHASGDKFTTSTTVTHLQSNVTSATGASARPESATCRFPLEFRCFSHYGDCVPRALLCDGFNDCLDGSDELGCGCGVGKFECGIGGKCISDDLRCDGTDHCGDSSDEVAGCKFAPKNEVNVQATTTANTTREGATLATTNVATTATSNASSTATINVATKSTKKAETTTKEVVRTTSKSVVTTSPTTETTTTSAQVTVTTGDRRALTTSATNPPRARCPVGASVCMNGGTCHLVSDTITCQCRAGFTGIICEIPCRPGETCGRGSSNRTHVSWSSLLLGVVLALLWPRFAWLV